ncbi:MAG: MFS transporter [Bacteroidales bacterium]|nr:MFS transporter [Bacteroidales bacterium]
MTSDINVPVYRNRNLYLIFIITLFAVMGVASITPAFPEIIKYFNISPKKVGWLIAAFTMPGIVLTPVMGILADRIGRKAILVPSLFLFGLAGSLCTLTRDFEVLVILRFFQGTGAAALGTINITLIGDLFTGNNRAAAMGYNASVLSIGTASYPFIGGALAMLGWNYPFIITLLAIPAGLVIILALKNPEPKDKQVLKEYIISVWKNINQKKVWGIFIINVLIFVILYGVYLTYFPLLLEERFKANSFIIGLVMSIMSLTTAFTSSQLGRVNKLFRFGNILIFSFAVYAIALIFIGFSKSWIMIILPVMTFGLGHGLLIPTIQNMLVGFAPIRERATFMSLNSMVLRLGQTFGPLVIGLFYGIGGITVAFIAGAGVAVIMILIKAFLVK